MRIGRRGGVGAAAPAVPTGCGAAVTGCGGGATGSSTITGVMPIIGGAGACAIAGEGAPNGDADVVAPIEGESAGESAGAALPWVPARSRSRLRSYGCIIPPLTGT